jgi:hypothetical protein
MCHVGQVWRAPLPVIKSTYSLQWRKGGLGLFESPGETGMGTRSRLIEEHLCYIEFLFQGRKKLVGLCITSRKLCFLVIAALISLGRSIFSRT